MSMSDRDGKIWMDGQMVEWRDAKIHVLTHTLHYGCGAFEGVRAYNTAHGTAAEVTPIRELDRIELGAGSRGPITEKIQAAFFDIVNGRNPKYAAWLTKV